MGFFTSSAVSALAPHLVDMVKGVLPLFTSNSKAAENDLSREQAIKVLNVQIAELQTAATAQAAAMRELAAKTEESLRAMETQLEKQRAYSLGALGVAVFSLVIAVAAIL
ncbi:MAG: hypothetical protein V4632_04840 [Pseudomonadota bacterium]